MENFIHNLVVENKRKVIVSGVKEVTAFSDRELKLKLKDGSGLIVAGSELKITNFDDKSGNFLATRYGRGFDGFIKKALK